MAKAGLFSIKLCSPSVFTEAPAPRTSQVLWEGYGVLPNIGTYIAVSPPIFLAGSSKLASFLGQDMERFS
jgi:hypothetical protein